VKSDRSVKTNLIQLRHLIDSTSDPILKRIAYAIETAVRWAREDVRGWPDLVEEAEAEAALLKKEIE
jgi:hypothetical protein